MSRKGNLIILVLALTAIGALAVIGFTFLIQSQIGESLIEEEAKIDLILTEQTAVLLEKEIRTIEEKVNLLAEFPEVKDGNSATCNRKLAEVAPYLKAQIDNVTRFNTKLTLDCAINQAAIGYVLTPESPITAVIKDPNHAPYLSYSGYSPTSNQEVLYLNLPVYRSNGVYSGIIGGVIYLNYISDKYLQSTNLGEGAYITLLDDNGNFLYHPDISYIGKNLNSAELVGNEPAIQALNKQAVDDSSKNLSGTTRYTAQNKEMLAVYAPASVFPNRTWTVVLTTPVQAILSKVDNNEGFGGLNLFISLSGAVVMVFILFSSLVLLFVIRKINESNALLEEKIKERTQELENSKLSIEETVKIRTAELEELKDSLEEKVKERTAAVEERVKELEDRNRFMIDRELKMVELKEENDSLKKKIG